MSRKIDSFDGEKYQRIGIVPHFGNWYFLGWLYAAGGNVTDTSGRHVAWNSPEGLKAAQLITGTLQRYGGAAQVDGFRDFQSGKVGMAMEGSWYLGGIPQKGEGQKVRIWVAAPPRPAGLEKDKVTWAGGFSVSP